MVRAFGNVRDIKLGLGKRQTPRHTTLHITPYISCTFSVSRKPLFLFHFFVLQQKHRGGGPQNPQRNSKMNHQNLNPRPVMTSIPCQYSTRNGNPCRYLAILGSTFCERHARKAELKEASSKTEFDLGVQLAESAVKLSSPEDLNLVLGQIFRALALDLISTRKAAVLGYLIQMVLRTQHEIFRRQQIEDELQREEDRENAPLLSRNIP
jgi:hypothetical protein